MTSNSPSKVAGLLLTIGLVSGLFAQYRAPGLYLVAHGKTEPTRLAEVERTQDIADAAKAEAPPEIAPPAQETVKAENPETPQTAAQGNIPPAPAKQAEAASEAASAAAMEASAANIVPPDELTPPVLRRYDAAAVVIGNTVEFTGPNGDLRTLYFAPRGVAAEFSAEGAEAQFWVRDDDRLCRSLTLARQQCFYLKVELEESLRTGSIKALPARIQSLGTGATIGSVEGVGLGRARLLRGDVRGLPGYIPLLEAKPGREWTEEPSGGRGFAGVLLLARRADGAEDQTRATFFAPNGQVIEATQIGRGAVRFWVGAWSIHGDAVCRNLPDSSQAGECAHPRVVGNNVEFAEAAPERRFYQRWPWADDDQSEQSGPDTPQVDLAPPTRPSAPKGSALRAVTVLRASSGAIR